MPLIKTVILLFFMWLGTGPVIADTIVYRGSSTVGQFMYEAARVYKASEFDINTRSESSGGEDSVAFGKSDIGGVAREIRQEILDKGVKKFLIGKDAIGILVHPSNPVSRLTLEQLAGIFSGEITNWRDIGGKDLPIDVYIVNSRSATRKVVQNKVLGKKAYGGKRIRTIRPDVRIAHLVSNNPGGVGQLSFSLINDYKVKLIHPNGERPALNNAGYPITRNLYLVTGAAPTKAVQKFLEWSLSPVGQKVVGLHFIGNQ